MDELIQAWSLLNQATERYYRRQYHAANGSVSEAQQVITNAIIRELRQSDLPEETKVTYAKMVGRKWNAEKEKEEPGSEKPTAVSQAEGLQG